MYPSYIHGSWDETRALRAPWFVPSTAWRRLVWAGLLLIGTLVLSQTRGLPLRLDWRGHRLVAAPRLVMAERMVRADSGPAFEILAPSGGAPAADVAVQGAQIITPQYETRAIGYQLLSDGPKRMVELDALSPLHPGKYSALITTTRGGQTHVLQEDFWWGVVAVNVRRSVVTPGAEQTIHIAVLDDYGRTVCDSSIELTVTDPQGSTAEFTSANGTVARNPNCRDRSVTNDPDYEVKYVTGGAGTYRIHVTASSQDGERSITDTFQVQSDPDVDLERTAFPSRIYPPADYPVSFQFTPTRDLHGTVHESVPASFVINGISDGGRISAGISDKTVQKITWSIDWQAGVTYSLGYTFKAPNISPLLHKLGPAAIIDVDGSPVFTESRQWLIAADATKTWDGGGSTASWSECANWDANACPANTGDAIVFNGTSNDNSDWDAGSGVTSIASLSVTSMSGSLTFTKTPVTIAGDFSHTSTGNVIFAGSASITVSGNFTLTTSGSLTVNTSVLKMDGTGGKSINTAKTLYDLNIDPSSNDTINVSTNSFTVSHTFTVAANDTLAIATGLTVTYTGTSDMALSGTVSSAGTGMIVFPSGSGGPGTAGTLTAWTRFDATGANMTNAVVDARNSPAYGGTVEFYSSSGSLRSVTLPAGTFHFSSNFYENAAGAGNTSITAAAGNPTVDIDGDLDWTGTGGGTEGLVMGTNSWTVGGDFNIEDGATPTIRTLILDGTGKNLKLNGKSITTLLQISGTITVTSTDGIIGLSGTLTVDANKTLTIDTSRTLSVNATSGTTITLNGTINGTGTLSYKSSTAFPTAGSMAANLRMDMSSSDQILSARTSPNGYGGNVEIYCSTTSDPAASRTLTVASGTIDITGNLSMNAAAACNINLTAATNDPALNIGGNLSATGAGGTKTFTVGAGNWKVSGDVTLTGATYTYESGNTLEMNGTATKTLTSASNSLYNFTVSGGGIAIGDTTDIDNNLSITSGTLTAPTTLTLGGSFDNDAAFVHNSGLITFNATTGTKTIDGDGTGTEAFNNVTFNDGGGSAEYQLTATADFDGNLTITGGNFNANSNNFNIGGSFDNDDTFTSGTQTTTFDATTSTKTIDADGTGAEAFSSVTFNDGGNNATYQLSTAIDIDANVTITGGIFDANTNAITVGGNWDNNDTFTTGATQTLTFDATDTNNTIEAGSQSYVALVFSGTGGGNGKWTIQTNDMTATNSINVNTGDEVDISGRTLTLGAGATTLTLDGTISGTGTLRYMSSNNFPSGASGGLINADLLYDCTNNDQMLRVRSYGGDLTLYNSSTTNSHTITTNTDAIPIAVAGNLSISAGDQDIYFTALTFNPNFTVGGNFANVGDPHSSGIEHVITGSGTWTISGDVDFTGLLLSASSGNTIKMDGTGGKILYPDGKSLYDLTIDPSSADTIFMSLGDLTVTHTLTVAEGDTLDIEGGTTLSDTGATNIVLSGATGGTISGDGTLRFTDASGGPGGDGTISAVTRYDATAGNIAATTFDARTYSDTVELYNGTSANRTITMASGNYIFAAGGNFNILMEGDSPYTLTVDASNGGASNPTVTIAGDLDFMGGGTGSEAIISGTGTWTISGNVDFTGGSYTATSGNTLTMNGTSNYLVGESQTLYNLTINPSSAGTITLQTTTVTVSNTLDVADSDELAIAGSLTLLLSKTSGASVTMNTTGTISGATSRLTYKSSAVFPFNGTISCILRFDSTDVNQNFRPRTYQGSVELMNGAAGRDAAFTSSAGSIDVANDLTFITAGRNINWNPNNELIVGDDVSRTGGGAGQVVLSIGSANWTVSGDVNLIGISATFENILNMNGVSAVLTFDGNSLNNFTVTGGSISIGDTADVDGNVTISGGSLTAPNNLDGSLTVGGSWDNNATFVHNTSLVIFDAGSTGKTIETGGSDFSSVQINGASGGWTIQTDNCTVTGDLYLTAATAFTVQSGRTLQVNGNFTNHVASVNTTWTGSTLYLNSIGGFFEEINLKTENDAYATLRIGASADVVMWRSSASVYTIDAGGCLLSQNASGVSGSLLVFGTCNARDNEYWSYATDFDGAALGGSSRQANVRFADTATLTVDAGDTLEILGQNANSNRTTISRVSGTYGLTIGGTINAQFYDFDYLNASGLNIASTATVTELSNGSFDNAGAAAASYITVVGITSTDEFLYNIFDQDTDGADSNVQYNVNANGAGINWTFSFAFGYKTGENYDNELNGAQINWNDLPLITFSISDNSMNLGILNESVIGSDTHTLTVTTNAANGYTCRVVEDGDLRNQSASAEINDVIGGTVTAGVEGYGLSCSGGGCDLAGDNGISGSPLTVASSAGSVTNEVTTMLYEAAVSTITPALDYSHIVTYTCTADF